MKKKFYYKDAVYVVCINGVVMFAASEEKQVNEYFLNPSNCPIHPVFATSYINNHKECWNRYPVKNFIRKNIISSDNKFIISLQQTYKLSQFGHIWSDFYYKLFAALKFINNHNFQAKSKVILLGCNDSELFSPDDFYYKTFNEKILNDFNIKNFEYSKHPIIYKINNVWISDLQYFTVDCNFINNYLVDETIKPWRKVYAHRSEMFGKKINTSMPENFFKDNNFNEPIDAFEKINFFNKRIYNEDNLKLFLENYGFECFDPFLKYHKEECKKIVIDNSKANFVHKTVQCVGGCKVEDLIKYMNEVKVIASVSSSALQNIIFMNTQNTNVIEFVTKIYQTEGQDSHESILKKQKELKSNDVKENYAKILNDYIKEILKSDGQYHIWHKDLANNLKINYSSILNEDLNANTIVNLIKNDEKILKIISE